MPVELPSVQVAALQELATRLLESRKTGGDLRTLARDLLLGFFDVCTRNGLDGALAALAVEDRGALAEDERRNTALVAQLETIDLDGGGPRNAKPKQLADCVVAALGLVLVDEPDRRIVLGNDVRSAVASALGAVAEVELAPVKMREAIIADARGRCDEAHQPTFAKIAAQLDERGLQLIKQPKVPIDALQAVQRALAEARRALVERVAGAAIDRAKLVIAKADAEAAARIDQPITLRATARQVAIHRACEPRVLKTPAGIVHVLLESLGELARISWRVPEQPVHPYAASRTFNVGDLIEHPKFGRGAVVSCLAQRIDVEFPDGIHTLAHVAPRR